MILTITNQTDQGVVKSWQADKFRPKGGAIMFPDVFDCGYVARCGGFGHVATTADVYYE